MGIRFHCPNGHRLNVKVHLAGKRGYCPHCNAKVQIPVLPAEQTLPPELLSEEFAMPSELDSESNGTDRGGLWYVRPPSGGQYGPVELDQLRRWITERRIPRDSLLLKEGWSEWQIAASVIADGFAQDDPNDAEVSIRLETSARPMALPRSGDKRQIRTALVLMMALLTIGLIVVLLLIVKVSR